MNDLPRQTYMTEKHAIAEDRAAKAFAKWAKADELRIGVDHPDKQKSRCDRLLYRNGVVVCFFEVKTCSWKFAGFPDGYCMYQSAIKDLRQLHAIVQLPVFLVVEFLENDLYYVSVMEDVATVENWGREDRNDPADKQPAYRYAWSLFKPACYRI